MMPCAYAATGFGAFGVEIGRMVTIIEFLSIRRAGSDWHESEGSGCSPCAPQTPRRGDREMTQTRIFTKPNCPYCAAAMADFKARGVPFQQIDAQGDATARDEMRRLSGGLRVPT